MIILGYREWANDLYKLVKEERLPYTVRWGQKLEDVRSTDDIVFLVGWSEIVPQEFYDSRIVVVLHPSPLPKYRGGSPIQHQIINGETHSAVTLFQLNSSFHGIDTGPIYGQRPYLLNGSLKEILGRIVEAGATLIIRLLEDYRDGCLKFTPQDDSQATMFKRRKPSESMLTTADLANGLHFYNKVRALQDPYPNACLKYPNGTLYITETKWVPAWVPAE